MAVAPRAHWRDALDVQHEMVRWIESEPGKKWMRIKQELEGQSYQERTRNLQQVMFAAVPHQLYSGVPMFVSSEMCRLVEAASETFQPEPIWPTDVLNLAGFLYYERPFQVPDRFDRPTTIKAISWTPVMSEADINPARLLSREDEIVEWLEERHSQGKIDGLALTIYSEAPYDDYQDFGQPPITPLHVTPWWWGMSFDGNDVDENEVPTGAEWWWKIVQTTWRLMQQHITLRRSERPYRPQRREAQRMGLPPHDVTVVTLRRERSDHPHDEPMSEMHYTHRFIVGGHWRRQHYAHGIVRQIYIADYEKGPEGAPLVIKPRAYNWTR